MKLQLCNQGSLGLRHDPDFEKQTPYASPENHYDTVLKLLKIPISQTARTSIEECAKQ